MTGFLTNGRIAQHFTPRLALSCGVLVLSAANYAFDNQGFNQSQAMDSFINQFGIMNAAGKKTIPPWLLSLMNSLPFVGFAFGTYIGSLISARWGRRMCIFVMSLWALVSASICISSHTTAQIIVGRVLNFVYVGMEISVISLFQAELVPAEIRGFVVGSYQLSIAAGGLVMSCVAKGVSTIASPYAWRIIFACYYFVPTVVACSIWFIPESPRWCAMNGRDEQALASLKALHGAKPDYDATEALFLIKEGLRNEPERGNFKELFQGTNLRRTLIAMGTNFFLQATGQAFASAYGTVFVKSLNTINPFTLNASTGVINVFMVLVGLFLADKIGRRPLMICGSMVQGFWLILMGILGCFALSHKIKSAIVACKILFVVAFEIGWAPMTYVVTAEIGALRLRDKTQRVAMLTNILSNFVVTFTMPYLLYTANLQSMVGFIYGAFAVSAALFAFFCIPELKGKTLEEIDHCFQANLPARAFGSYKVPEKGADGSSLEKSEDVVAHKV